MFTLTRSEYNPILSPHRDHPWEAAAAFNGCPIVDGKLTRMVYRAMSEPDYLNENNLRTSIVAAAESKDGFFYENRHGLILPDKDYDRYGCEDPRITKFEGKYYIFYTALGGYPFGADNIKVAVAVCDDLDEVSEKHLVTPFNAKAMAMFPERINGKISALVTVNTDRKPSDICYVEFNKIEDMWSTEFWNEWWKNLDSHKISIRRLQDDHLELGAPPVKTDNGWILVYSHIQRYGQPDQVFGIEIVLLNKNNPRTIHGRTKGPFMVPEEYYEQSGMVSHCIFPSGALIRNDKLEIYYGAADTHVAMAKIPLKNLLRSIDIEEPELVKRFPGNPIISPRPSMLWEAHGTFNPASIELGGSTHILYRAVSADNISTIGYASSSDGLSIDERSDKPIYFPRADFESKGCEDPRTMVIGSKVYMTYTAYDGAVPRVAVSSIATTDFLKKRWAAWAKPEIITPQGIANKDSAILPELVNGKYMIFHRVNNCVCADFVNSLDFSKEKVTRCIEIIVPRRGMWDGGKVGISAPPVKTPAGWLLLYHGVSWSTTYRVGAVLLDLKDPTVIKARTAVPLFEPKEEYERKGVVPNVVFPCGMDIHNRMAYIYYGAGDDVVGVATVKMTDLLKMMEV
jgi:predicted GH43/DUF377 family glycosyl hydrolase